MSKGIIFAGVFVTLVPFMPAAESNLNDKFYAAIRADDTNAIEHLLKAGADVNAKDSRGTVPLMYAAAVGTPGMMRRLIAAGADVNAKNSFDATALLWCTNDLEKVRLLAEKGADVNARSKAGRTILLNAATHQGNIEVVRILLRHGASLEKAGGEAWGSPLLAAAAADDNAIVQLLIDRGESVNTKDAGGFTPLMLAAMRGNAETVKKLIARGADVNARSAPSFGFPVKNGPVAVGNLTPLLLAAVSGSAETVRLLLEAGADVNAKDVRGMTPIMLAVATDRPDEKTIRLLLARKPAMDLKSNAGETALAWAARFRNPSILPALKTASPGIDVPQPQPAAAGRESIPDLHQAVAKSIALLQHASGEFFKNGGCMSCHSHNITTMAIATARPKGVSFDPAIAAETSRGTRLQFAAATEGMLERLDPPAVEILTYALIALAFDGVAPDRITDAAVHNIAAHQHMDGSWGRSGIVRPPMADGSFSVTATAIRALREYGPPARKAEMEQRVSRAAAWLMKAEPRTTEDQVMQLLGLKWAGMEPAKLQMLARKLLEIQREDGGWAQTPYLQSDAYATGTALYALHEAGSLPSREAAYQKGVRYLLRTQANDGSWYVASRAAKFQPYFDGGFPYGHDQWISQMATGWAGMALSLAIPGARQAD